MKVVEAAQRSGRHPGKIAGILLTALVSLAAGGPAIADPAEPAEACLEAAFDAQEAWQLPPDVLAAIGRVESGRYDPLLGRVAPWPWTINALGRGAFYATKAEAIEAVEQLEASGVDTIDVGCFQVNLHYHPEAFESLAMAFDPAANANYAARFLTELQARTGGWDTAVALYHSAWPGEGESYRQRVLVSLGDAGMAASGAAGAARFAHAAPARHRPPAGDPYVIMISASAAAIRVFGPDGPVAIGLPVLPPVPAARPPAAAIAPLAGKRPGPVHPIGQLRPFRLPPATRPGGMPNVITPRTPI